MMLRPDGGNFRLIDREAAYQRWSIYPEQMADYLALVGDSSDNVPGVAGIGAKSAVALLDEWGTLAKLYENIESIKSKSLARKADQRTGRAPC